GGASARDDRSHSEGATEVLLAHLSSVRPVAAEYAKSTVRHYHIVLLGGGVVQRTWVADKSTVPFEGQHQFEQLQGDAPWGGSAVNEASGPKLSKHFSAKVRAQWEEGMAEVAKGPTTVMR
ncbi:histone-lysine N-methyltransferase NSD2-like, partial [Lethenteron reissneri]|uniref:histone-lysine N-methyltransferase NSD2-like n=1 Tax=Lethenteron reissneri TaxID=7753 RepID=UPI002AB725B9